MPIYTATGYRWTGTFYGNPSTPAVTITIDDDDPQVDWFGSGDSNQLVTTSDGLHTNAVISGGSLLGVRMDFGSNGTQDAVEQVAFFQVSGDWYFIPLPGSGFAVGDTLLGNTGQGWTDNGVGWNYSDVTCFAKGTRLETDKGPRRIETLQEGDLIWTEGAGFQPLLWLGQSAVEARGDLAPILIRKGALGNTRDVLVSPNHAVLLRDWRAELLFGVDEVLVRAADLTNGKTIYATPMAKVTYMHVLLDGHHIVRTEGLLSESFRPGPVALQSLRPDAQREILRRFPSLCMQNVDFGPRPRTTARGYEAACL